MRFKLEKEIISIIKTHSFSTSFLGKIRLRKFCYR